MVQVENINDTVVHMKSLESENTRTDREMSVDENNNNITHSIPSCTALIYDSHHRCLATACVSKPNKLDSGHVSSDDSQSKDDVDTSGNSDSDFVFIDEDNSNEVSNIIEDFQSKEYHEINGQESNCDSDFVSFIKETDTDVLYISKDVNETLLKRDWFYDTQGTAVGFEIGTINEKIFDGSSNRKDLNGCEEDTRTDIIHDKKQDCSMVWEMQMISRKPFDMLLFLWKTDTITLVWIIVKMGIIVTATLVSIVKFRIVVTATMVSIVKLEMVVMKLVNEVDTCTKESEDYIEHTKADGEMKKKELSFAIIDIDDKGVVVKVQNGKDTIEKEHASDNSQQNEDSIYSRYSVVEIQRIDCDNDGKRVTGKMQRKICDIVGAKVWLENSLEENEIVCVKAVGDILEKEDNFNDIKAVVDIRGKTNELVCQRVDDILGKAYDFNGDREAAKVKEEDIEISGEKNEEKDEINAKTTLKEIQRKHADIGDYKAVDKKIRNDAHIYSKRSKRESVKKVEETAGKSQRQNTDFVGEKIGSEIVEEDDHTNCKKAVGEILETEDHIDGEKVACCNSEKDEKWGVIGGLNDINKIQEEIKEDIIPREQNENIDYKKAVDSRIEDEMRVGESLKDTKVFDEQYNKEDYVSTTNAVGEIQETTSCNINAIKANRDKMSSLHNICLNGKNFDQVELSGPKTVHTTRDWNNFETVIMLLLICGIRFARGASNELSTKVTWSLQTNPAVFGSNTTLCCIIENPDTNHMAWVRDPDAMIVATGNSPSNPMKYSASVEPRGNITYYRLTIINIDMTDINVNYKCESGFDLFEKKLEMREESFIMKPSTKETATNISRVNGIITFSIRMQNLYPKPDCFFSSKKEKIKGNVSLEKNSELYNVQMTLEISEDMCEHNISAYCALGKETVSIDLSSSNNSWTNRCIKDRHVGDAVLIITVIIIITLVFIVIITGWLLKNYFSRKFNHAFKPVFV